MSKKTKDTKSLATLAADWSRHAYKATQDAYSVQDHLDAAKAHTAAAKRHKALWPVDEIVLDHEGAALQHRLAAKDRKRDDWRAVNERVGVAHTRAARAYERALTKLEEIL